MSVFRPQRPMRLGPRLMAVAALSAALLACGSSNVPQAPDAGAVDAGAIDAGMSDAGTPDAGTSDAGTPDAGTSDAGTPDAGTPDAGTPDAGTSDAGTPDAGTPDAGPTQVTEQESTGVRSNDFPEDAESITPDTEVTGLIDSYNMVALDDIDVYGFDAQVGDLFRITLAPNGATDFRAWALVRDVAADYLREVVSPSGGASATRQFYIPRTGRYLIVVRDERNTRTTPLNVGGPTYGYRLTLVRETLAPIAVSLPVAARTGTLDANGSVVAFSFDATAGAALRAEVRARRLQPASSLDPALSLVDTVVSGSPVLLATNDDIDIGQMNYDSLVQASATRAGAHLVVLDFFTIEAGTPNYEIDIDATLPDGGP